jgi:hypothetical protein
MICVESVQQSWPISIQNGQLFFGTHGVKINHGNPAA